MEITLLTIMAIHEKWGNRRQNGAFPTVNSIPGTHWEKASAKDRHRERGNSPFGGEERSRLGRILRVISRNDKLKRLKLCKERRHVSVEK